MATSLKGGINVTGPSRVYEGYSEILKFPAGLDAIASVVLDASTVAPDANGVRKLRAGTLLTKSGNQYVRFTGAGNVAGVLGIDVEFADGSANSDTPAPMFFHGCVFRADRIIDFGAHGANARTNLPTCRFD